MSCGLAKKESLGTCRFPRFFRVPVISIPGQISRGVILLRRCRKTTTGAASPRRRRRRECSNRGTAFGLMAIGVAPEGFGKYAYAFGHLLHRNLVRAGQDVARSHAVDLAIIFVVRLDDDAFQLEPRECAFAA